MTDHTNALEALRQLEAGAANADTKKCIKGEPMLWLPYERALIPGHIYSESGLSEAKISGCCEYHFDRWFEPGWVDAITGEHGDTPAE